MMNIINQLKNTKLRLNQNLIKLKESILELNLSLHFSEEMNSDELIKPIV